MKKAFMFLALAFFLIVLTSNPAKADLSDDLHAYYELNGTGDDSHNSNDGVITSLTYAGVSNCKLNTCYYSGGSFGNFSAPSLLLGQSAGTLNLWAQVENVGAVQRNIFGSSGALFRSQLFSTGNLIPYAQVNGAPSVTASSGFSLGGFTMFTFVWNSSGEYAFINGSAAGSTAGSFTAPTSYLQFFTNGINSNEHFQGYMDEIGFWNRSLTTAEISQLWNSGAGLSYSDIVGGGATNFTVTLTDSYDGSGISNFTVTIDGTSYTTTTGTVSTGILNNATSLYDINITDIQDNGGYFNKSYYDVNVSSSTLAATAFQAQITMSATEKYTGNALTGNFNASLQSDTTTLYLKAGTIPVTFTTTGYVTETQNITLTALSNTSATISNVSNRTLTIQAKYILNGATINTFNGWVYNNNYSTNESFSTTSGSYVFNAISGFNYTVYVDAAGYVNAENNYTTLASNTTMAFYLYKTNTVYFEFIDELNGSLVGNVTLELIGDTASYLNTTANGTLLMEVLDPNTYTARYSAPNYAERFYFFELVNRTFYSIDLYLLPTTDAQNITVTVYDQYANKVEGAEVRALKYNVSSNAYYLVSSGETNVEGETILVATLNDEFYKFQVLYNDVLVKTTNPAYITSNDITIQITLGGTGSQFYTDYIGISSDLSFNTGTDNFRWEYSDGSGVGTSFCLNIYRTQTLAETLLNTSCSTSSSATILLPIYEPVNGSVYTAKAYYYSDDTYNLIDSLSYTYPDTNRFGNTGLFYQILLTFIISLMAIFSPPIALIGVPISLMVGALLGLHTLSWGIMVPLLIIGVIISFSINNRGY